MDISKIPEHKKQEYIKEYDDMEWKNISLAEFIMMKNKEREANLLSLMNYAQSVAQGDEQLTKFRVTKPEGMSEWVPRTIVIDGPNVMHCGSTYRDAREGTVQKAIPDVAALLSLMRFFVSQNFNVVAVISRKYITADATNHKAALEELVRHNLCVITSHSNLDDTIALDLAAQVNGLVVTSDKYVDHTTDDRRYRRVVSGNRLGIDWHDIPAHGRNKRCRRTDDFIANKRFVFKDHENRPLSRDEMLKKIYVAPEDIQYEITKERNDLARPEANYEKWMCLLNRLIVDGISQCPRNVERILSAPVFAPARVRNNERGGPKASDDDDFIDRYEDDYEDW